MKQRLVLAGLSALLIAIGLLLPGGASEARVGAGIPLMITNNSLRTSAILENALTVNQISLEQLDTHPLSTATFADPTLQLGTALQLDPNAHEVMTYLVGCALKPGVAVTWGSEVWKGELGLCPEWADGPASEACQERVSACVLARNNAFGVRVSISLRGKTDAGAGFSMVTGEAGSYPYREGAFFGNMLDPAGVNPNAEVGIDWTPSGPVLVPPAVPNVKLVYKAPGTMQAVYMKMFACGAPTWQSDSAYTIDRICAISDGTEAGAQGCAARYVGPCSTLASGPAACAVDDGAGQGDYEGCASPGRSGTEPPITWQRPITTFVHETCDVIPKTILDANQHQVCALAK